MAYGGSIGKPDGVKIYFMKNNNGKVDSTIKIEYYAWNNRLGHTEGYGTLKLDIRLSFSKNSEEKGFRKQQFALIEGGSGGGTDLEPGDLLTCGRVISKRKEMSKDGEHRHNIIEVKLNPDMEVLFNTHIAQVIYRADVNADKSYNNVAGLIIDKNFSR